MESLIAEQPPADGREWDVQCARCGSSMMHEECASCDGDGETALGELYDQDPLWYDVGDTRPCPQCDGEGGWMFCLSGYDWCRLHPLPGRIEVEPHTIEWFTTDNLKAVIA